MLPCSLFTFSSYSLSSLQLLRKKKPTGDAECPEEIEEAHEIEDMINEKVGTRDLDDDELAGEVDRYVQTSH